MDDPTVRSLSHRAHRSGGLDRSVPIVVAVSLWRARLGVLDHRGWVGDPFFLIWLGPSDRRAPGLLCTVSRGSALLSNARMPGRGFMMVMLGIDPCALAWQRCVADAIVVALIAVASSMAWSLRSRHPGSRRRAIEQHLAADPRLGSSSSLAGYQDDSRSRTVRRTNARLSDALPAAVVGGILASRAIKRGYQNRRAIAALMALSSPHAPCRRARGHGGARQRHRLRRRGPQRRDAARRSRISKSAASRTRRRGDRAVSSADVADQPMNSCERYLSTARHSARPWSRHRTRNERLTHLPAHAYIGTGGTAWSKNQPAGRRTMSRRRAVWALCALLAGLTSVDAYAQGGSTSTISGVVTDTAKGVIPGATVVVTSNATGTKYDATTNSAGTFSVPALSAGLYSVTVSLTGFRTAIITDVRVQPVSRPPSTPSSTWEASPRPLRSRAPARS